MLLTLNKTDDVNPTSLKKLEKIVSMGNTMLLNHATWCGHCNVFLPQWQKLTTDVKKVNFVQIENDALQQIKKENLKLYKRITPKDGMIYFPMVVVFIVKNSDKPSQKKIYEGNRTSESLQTYIKDNMKVQNKQKAGKSSSSSPSQPQPSSKKANVNLKTDESYGYKSLHQLNVELDELIHSMM